MNSVPKDKASRTFNNRFYIKKRISAGINNENTFRVFWSCFRM